MTAPRIPGSRPHDSRTHDSRRLMDQELRLALDAVPMTPNGAFDLTDLATTRAAFRAQAESAADSSPADPSVTVEEHLASRADRTYGPDVPVPVRLLRPTAAPGPLPVLLWFHGGGQVLGFAAQDEPWLTRLAASLGCAVAAVDYRLAPETPAPGAAEDGFTAYEWLAREADALGLDATRIGIAGQSGGGGIAAATTLLVRDRGGVAPLFQSLTYPMLDDRNRTASSHEITDIGIWDRSTNLLAWEAILGDRAGTEDVCPYAAPARADDLADLPPTFITVGDLDCFRDEDLDYATRLRAQGVPVELHLYPGAYHAFDLIAPDSRLAAAFHRTWFDYLARRFAAVPVPA
ncbi:alpha/beta hydrolase [Kitasatospora sp. NPDC094019]|uniref:alpha/beta hydrolase n=1 Tax=Kitasatospora sp. NPDC094019 TaxID=3364091 RepID=UPI0037F938BC